MKSKLIDIPVKLEQQSGQKYQTEHGFSAIRDGLSDKFKTDRIQTKKPKWLRTPLGVSAQYQQVKQLVSGNRLSTVCEEAMCPNVSECWSHGTATLMLMGSVCTRACRFCSVDTGNPKGWLDQDEPQKAAQTVKVMNLDYVVLTSVDRDDLSDGGAAHYAKTVEAIKAISPKTKVEALTPDFSGKEASIDLILQSGVDVFAQNVETVERLTHPVRDPRADYWQSINVLKYAKSQSSDIYTKTSLMLGLGETREEIIQTMNDLRAANVDILTLGQYMQPTANHLPVECYVTPQEFEELRQIGLGKGFFEVASGPMVRSSYRADRIFKRDNIGLSA